MRRGKTWFVGTTIGLSLIFAAAAAEPPAEPARWLASARHDLEQREYELSWQASPVVDDVEASWHAPNRSQAFRTYFTSEGIRVVPRTGSAPSWRWGLSLGRVRPGGHDLGGAAGDAVPFWTPDGLPPRLSR